MAPRGCCPPPALQSGPPSPPNSPKALQRLARLAPHQRQGPHFSHKLAVGIHFQVPPLAPWGWQVGIGMAVGFVVAGQQSCALGFVPQRAPLSGSLGHCAAPAEVAVPWAGLAAPPRPGCHAVPWDCPAAAQALQGVGRGKQGHGVGSGVARGPG